MARGVLRQIDANEIGVSLEAGIAVGILVGVLRLVLFRVRLSTEPRIGRSLEPGDEAMEPTSGL